MLIQVIFRSSRNISYIHIVKVHPSLNASQNVIVVIIILFVFFLIFGILINNDAIVSKMSISLTMKFAKFVEVSQNVSCLVLLFHLNNIKMLCNFISVFAAKILNIFLNFQRTISINMPRSSQNVNASYCKWKLPKFNCIFVPLKIPLYAFKNVFSIIHRVVPKMLNFIVFL